MEDRIWNIIIEFKGYKQLRYGYETDGAVEIKQCVIIYHFNSSDQ